MNQRTLMLGLLVLLIVSVSCNPSSDPDTTCDPYGCISLSKFAKKILNALDGKVAGYAIMVGGTFPLTGGLARTTADAPSYAMGISSQINIASSSKVLTTIGVLQLLAKNNLTIDDKIAPYLYPDWLKGPNVDTITFRELLTHRAGFRVDCNGDKTTYDVLKLQIMIGVLLSDKATPQYNNCNFAIFRELIPVMEGGTVRDAVVAMPGFARGILSAGFYIDYMNKHVFNPLGLSDQKCYPDSGGALSYPFPTGATHGTDWGDWTNSCGGGGWVMSASDLFAVINDLASGNVLLTEAQKDEMNSNCLGWDCSVRSDCPNPPYVCKNGDLGSSGKYVWTYVGIFKCDVPVVVIVNSALPTTYQESGDIIGLVEDAYNGAIVDGSPQKCERTKAHASAATATPIIPTPTGTLHQVAPLPQLTPRIQPPIVRPTEPATPRIVRPEVPPEPRETATRPPTAVRRDTTAPRPPILISPINGAAIECVQVTLKWKSADDPSGIRDYDAQLQKLVNRTFEPEKTWDNIRGDSATFSPSCNTSFRWRVRATDNAGNVGTWSDFEEFFVRASIR